jgi:hypothetical protein
MKIHSLYEPAIKRLPGLILHDNRPSHLVIPHITGNKDALEHFQVNLTWLLYSETTVYAEHGGKTLSSFTTYNDSYGFLTSAASAIGPIEEMKKRFAVSINSSLSLVSKTTLFASPHGETKGALKEKNDAIRHKESPHFYLPDISDAKLWVPESNESEWGVESSLLSYSIIEKDILTYSSKYHASQNKGLQQDLLDRWKPTPGALTLDDLKAKVNPFLPPELTNA